MSVVRCSLRLAVAAAGLALCGAHAVVTEISWDPQGRFEHRGTVQPGRFVEVCGRLGRDDVVAWRFEAEAPLDFNIHYHEGRTVHYPERPGTAASAQGRLRVAVEHDHCWMWTNKAATATALTLRLQRER